MPSEYELAEIEKIAAFIYIIASIAIIESAVKTQSEELNKQNGINTSNDCGLTPAQIVVLSNILFLIGSLLFAKTAIIRLKQVQIQAMQNPNVSVLPNKYITLSQVLSTLSYIIGTVGAQLKSQESNIAII